VGQDNDETALSGGVMLSQQTASCPPTLECRGFYSVSGMEDATIEELRKQLREAQERAGEAEQRAIKQ
jgi:hypothetical protein